MKSVTFQPATEALVLGGGPCNVARTFPPEAGRQGGGGGRGYGRTIADNDRGEEGHGGSDRNKLWRDGV